MALTYDNSFSNSNLKGIYTYDSTAGTFSANLKASTAFDYFLNTAVVGDCLYILSNDVQAFKNLRIYVGTAFAATSVTFTWEYSTGNGSWAALTNVVNGNAFESTGQQDITWDIPRNWTQSGRHTVSPLVNLPATGGWIRARISAINTPTEGGAQSTQTAQTGRNLITITSGTESFASIRAADVAGGWGVVDATLSGMSIQLYASLTIASGATLKASSFMVEVINSLITNGGTITLGTYSSTYDFSYNGWFLYFKSFGYGGGHSHFSGGGAFNLYGGTVKIAYPGKVGAFGAGTLRDTLVEGYYQGFTCNGLTIDRLRVAPSSTGQLDNSSTANTITEMWVSGRFFLAQQWAASSTAENVTADYISAYSVYTARNIYLINPSLVSSSPLRVEFFALGGGDHDVNYHTQFRFDLKVVDNNGNAISSAGVVIIDVDGTEIFSGATDASGNIAQQVLTKQIDFFNDPNPAVNVTVSTPTATYIKTPHTITISATGYQTKTMVLDMDRKREEVVVLEKEVKFITAGGDPLLWNLDASNNQNKHKWSKV